MADELERMIEVAVTEQLAMDVMPAGFAGGARSGTAPSSYRQIIRAALSRVREAIADPSVIPPRGPNDDGMTLPRTSAFLDRETAERACALVIRAHYPLVRKFQAEPASLGWRALHLYADLSTEMDRVGTVMTSEPDAGSRLDVERGEVYLTSAAVVVVRRDLDTGEVYMRTAYPELPLDTAVRAHFPALCHFYGPWFGQHRDAPAHGMQDVCSSTKEPAFSQVRAELDLLLSVAGDDEDELRRILEACGSYVLPVRVKHWVERTRWRLDAYDWLPGEPITNIRMMPGYPRKEFRPPE